MFFFIVVCEGRFYNFNFSLASSQNLIKATANVVSVYKFSKTFSNIANILSHFQGGGNILIANYIQALCF